MADEKDHELMRAQTALLIAQMEAFINRAKVIIADRRGLIANPESEPSGSSEPPSSVE